MRRETHQLAAHFECVVGLNPEQPAVERREDERIFRRHVAGLASPAASCLSQTRVVGHCQREVARVLNEATAVEQDDAVAQRASGWHVVADKKYSPAGSGNTANFSETPLLELEVADREHFVDDEDLRLEV